MKAVGEYVIVEQEVSSASRIMIKENNVGKVIDCQIDKSLIGKTVIFSEAKTIQEYDGYKFVPIAQVMAVIE
jgi:hypothetical protein|tara:strand:+ start:3067 stop:3282 length:216 start_codon:yes stop_codon:yes gene_type:complete